MIVDLPTGIFGSAAVWGAVKLLLALLKRRADNEALRIEASAKHHEHVQEQIRGLQAENDFQAVEMKRLRDAETRAQVERAELAIRLQVAKEDAAELARVEQELEDERHRNASLARELADVKRAAAQLGHATVTPLRPPKGGST